MQPVRARFGLGSGLGMGRWAHGAALVAAVAVGAAGAASADEPVLDGIAAQVGSDIVLVSEVQNMVRPIEQKMKEAGAPDAEIAALRADALERLIERALIRQVVRRAELEATDAEVDNAIATIAQENGLSMQQLVATVEAEGLPYPGYRERIKGEIEQSKVLNGMVASKVHVDESEVRAAYHEQAQGDPEGGEEVHLRHLLVPFAGDGVDARRAACATAERARVRLEKGESFELVLSQVAEKAPGSGDIGWVHQGRLASWMADKVSAVAPGGVTPVVETDFGCNVVQVVDRRAYTPQSYEEAHDAVQQRIFSERMQHEYLKFMDKLREQTYIERKGVFASAPPVGAPGADTSEWSTGASGDPSGF